MGVRKRGAEYHYEFMQKGQRFYGVCEGCTNKTKAIEYEKRIKATIKDVTAQKNVKALIENHKRELTGGIDITLSNAFEQYLNKPARRHPGPMRLEVNRRRWDDFVAYMAEKYPDVIRLDQVSAKHAEDYIDYLRNNGRFIQEVACGKDNPDKHYTPKRTSLSSKTINEYHTILKSVFSRLEGDAGIVDNPFNFDSMDANTESRDIFTMDELELIHKNLPSDPFCRVLFIIGANTGLSLGDVCTLQWSDLRTDENGCFICRRRNKTGVSLEIPVMPAVRDLLAELAEKRKGLEEEQKSLFILPEHEFMYRTNRCGVSYRINRFLKNIGIKTTRDTTGARRASVKDFHSLRHTFAYLAGINHIPLSVVQAVLGHMSPQMTQHYQEHATRADKVSFMNQLPALIGDNNDTMAGRLDTHNVSPHLLPAKRDGMQPHSTPREKAHMLIDRLPDDVVLEILEKYGAQE